MSDEPTPEQIEAAKKWLDTDEGQKFAAAINKIEKLVEDQKNLVDELCSWLQGIEANNDESYRLIGSFIAKFSQMEVLLRFVLSIEARVLSSLSEALMMSLDFASLVNTLKDFYKEKLKLNTSLQKKVEKTLNSCLEINTDRVRVAHGTWILNESDNAKLLSLKRGGTSSQIYYGSREQMIDLIGKVEKARDNLIQTVKEIFEFYGKIE